MDKKVYKILVPYDFTSVADYAIKHAIKFAKSFNGEVHLLHVVSKAKDVNAVKEKLNIVVTASENKYGVTIHSIIRIGNIFEDIGNAASEIDAGYIVMGTHGAIGIQKIIGSNAIKIISHSKVPLMVVQEKGPNETDTYNDIVVPIDYSDVTKQKLTIAGDIALHFNSKVHIFAAKESDSFLQTKLDQELRFAENYFTKRLISYSIENAKDIMGFKQQMIKYASKINADLIAIVNTQKGKLLPDFFGSDEQEVIANEAKIPVIITNPTQEFVPGGIIGS